MYIVCQFHIPEKVHWGTWVAQSAECLSLDFSSGQDLRVVRLSPMSGSVLSVELKILCFPLPLSPALCFLSKIKKKKKKRLTKNWTTDYKFSDYSHLVQCILRTKITAKKSWVFLKFAFASAVGVMILKWIWECYSTEQGVKIYYSLGKPGSHHKRRGTQIWTTLCCWTWAGAWVWIWDSWFCPLQGPQAVTPL